MHGIIPAIIPKNFADVLEKCAIVKGAVSTVQIDLVDGIFAPNKTWPFYDAISENSYPNFEIDKLPYPDEINFEFDLMVSKPQEIIADLVRLGANTVIIHIESIVADSLSTLIHEWKHTVEIGLATKPSTPASKLETFLHEVSMVQCMGNDKIGFQGVSLDEKKVLPKITDLRKRHPNLNIGVDIGVNFETASELISAGANRLVAGSSIFNSVDPVAAIKKLQSYFKAE